MSGERLAKGVFRDRYGVEVRWRERGRTRTKRFPLDTPLEILKAQQANRQRFGASTGTNSGSFPRDVVRWLARRRGLPSFKSDRAHLRPWVHRFKKYSRWTITADQIRAALDEWRRAGYSARTIRHRLRVLAALYKALDGTTGPCIGLRAPSAPKPRPVSVSDKTIQAVARQLFLQEQDGVGRLRDAKTRARFLVLATTGQRPAQVQRAQPIDVDLQRRIWFVRPAKGDRGAVVYLNDDMVGAWTLFIRAKAWGRYDSRSFSKTLQRNGWPKGIRPYNLRHSVGLALSAAGVELGDVQAHMGHSDVNTTRTFYLPAILPRLKAASQAIDGRLGDVLLHATTTPASEQKAKERQKRPHSAHDAVQQKGRPRGPRSSKTA